MCPNRILSKENLIRYVCNQLSENKREYIKLLRDKNNLKENKDNSKS